MQKFDRRSAKYEEGKNFFGEGKKFFGEQISRAGEGKIRDGEGIFFFARKTCREMPVRHLFEKNEKSAKKSQLPDAVFSAFLHL
ncbi:MAG: hypothetical protein J6T94_00240 [Bacteroidaceae bacterium]|nr:hypothetical protein [Bacteroidaceae bacterium]